MDGNSPQKAIKPEQLAERAQTPPARRGSGHVQPIALAGHQSLSLRVGSGHETTPNSTAVFTINTVAFISTAFRHHMITIILKAHKYKCN